MYSETRQMITEFNHVQRMYLAKGVLSAFTLTLLIAILTREIVENFSSDIVLLKNYLSNIPMLLIMVPFVRTWVKKNPVTCYRIKGILSVAALLMLIIVEIVDAPKWWYLVDAAIVSFTGLLMMPHTSYYKSYVTDKSKEFSEVVGYVGMVNEVTIVVIGLAIVYFNIPTLTLLLLAFPLEIMERLLENKCVDIVYDE